jgi:hypothetical protein
MGGRFRSSTASMLVTDRGCRIAAKHPGDLQAGLIVNISSTSAKSMPAISDLSGR